MDPTTTPPADDAPEGGVRPVDLRDHVTFSDEHAHRVRVFAADQLALDLWCLQPKQTTPVLHEPGRDVTYTVLAGRSWFVTDDGEVGLDPLGAMLVPAGVVHGIGNRSPDPLIVVAVSSPPSPDPEDAPASEARAAVTLEREGPGMLRRAVEGLLGVGRDGR